MRGGKIAARVTSRAALLTSIALSLLCLGSISQASTSLWKVSKHAYTLYLGGTIHVLRATDYPLPPPYQQAFDQADIVVFETDLRATASDEFQRSLVSTMHYPPGESLGDHLTTRALDALEQHCKHNQLTLSTLLSLKPAWASLSLLSAELDRLELAPEGVDHYFMTQAVRQGKQIFGLETPQQQINFISRLGIGNESALILHTLADITQTGQLLEMMVQAWRQGNADVLQQAFVDPLAHDYPEIYQTLLVDRNRMWLPQLEHLLLQQRSALVLVGVAHLVGKDGLLALLADKGYQLEAL